MGQGARDRGAVHLVSVVVAGLAAVVTAATGRMIVGGIDLAGASTFVVALGATFAIVWDRVISARNQREMLASQRHTAAVVAPLAEAVKRIEPVIADTHVQVTTLNGSTLAQLADADATRRIEGIKPEDRTDAEAEHIEVVPPPADAAK